MRVNVYNEELTNEVRVVEATPETGKTFTGVQFVLASAPELHHDADDDDRSAITIWADSRGKLETILETALEELRG
jgi:hypothetical protein